MSFCNHSPSSRIGIPVSKNRKFPTECKQASCLTNTMASNKKEREHKFSLDDCIILCNLMAKDCGIAFLHGLSNHDLIRHRFTEGVTAAVTTMTNSR
ncbi:hypothetical protein DPMN_022251 [Dreissena polymorpha]|uniref:Uncharacterized protein n=1 Tax=Dreissena polymorpha TaxID=45954 RepID=A0A9D4NQ28_DREPO|nr:hypothetical protein DPMN_022251 [Dreissena polymorpha]